MGMKIPGVTTPGLSPGHPVAANEQAARLRFPDSQSRLGRMETRAEVPSAPSGGQDLRKSLDLLEDTFLLFNRRLKFSVNEEINRVVVKVVDGSTDKVIKEIPPEEIQRLIVRIKETIGLLFDEQI